MSANKENTVDLGGVSEEDPAALSNVAVNAKPEKKARKSKSEASAPSDATPKEPKVPVTGEYGKRGLPNWSVSLVEGVAFEGDAAKHHQRVIIYNMLSEAGGTMTAADLITSIENDPAKLNGMNTTQPIMRCVAYQVNELVKRGIATTTKPERATKQDASQTEAAAQEAAASNEATTEQAAA